MLADTGTGLRKVRALLGECADKIGTDERDSIVADALNEAARAEIDRLLGEIEAKVG